MKKYFLLILVLVLVLLTACVSSGVVPPTSEQKQVEEQQKVYEGNQPIPAFDWSLERDVLVQLFMARNEALSTYTIVMDSFGGVIYECPSIGYPVAANTKLTNPEKIVEDRGEYGGGNLTIAQPEPNGLYNDNGWGTWVMCVLDDGTVYPFYTEQNAQTWPFPVVKTENGFVMADGAVPSKTLDITRDELPMPEATLGTP